MFPETVSIYPFIYGIALAVLLILVLLALVVHPIRGSADGARRFPIA